MANPNPKNKFPKGNKLGRKPGQPNLMPGEEAFRTAAAESYRLYLPHWNRFRKPPPDRAAEKGSVAVHGHCEATLTWAPRRSSTARRPRACAKKGSPVHDREKSDPRGLLLVHVHPRAVSGACPEALRKQAGAAARLEE